MTTNSTPPTEPLSFKEYFAQQDDSRYFRDVVRKAEPEVYEWGEAYAAQQTVELTASIAVLQGALSRAYRELNEIQARSGAPRNELGCTMVDEDYFASVVNSVRAALNNLPAAAQAHLDEVARLKATTSQLSPLIAELTAENERLTQALADTVADVKLLREALAWYDDKNATEALAQTEKEAYR